MADKSFFLTLTKGTFFKDEEDPDIELLTERNTTGINQDESQSPPDCLPDLCEPTDPGPDVCGPLPDCLPDCCDPNDHGKSESIPKLEEIDEEDESNQETPSP